MTKDMSEEKGMNNWQKEALMNREVIKSLESRLKEAEAELAKFPELVDKSIVEELQNRLSTLEKELAKYQSHAFCPVHQLKPDLTVVKCLICDQEEKQKLSTLLKASEGMEKALESYLPKHQIDARTMWVSSQHQKQYEEASSVLADFRAVKGTK